MTHPDRRRLRVRIIDDYPAIAEMLATVLGMDGCDVDVVTEGFDALGSWDGIDVAIVDLMLGDKATGVDILCDLAEHHPGIRRVVFSAVANLHDGIDDLADVVLAKPVSNDVIVRAVRGE